MTILEFKDQIKEIKNIAVHCKLSRKVITESEYDKRMASIIKITENILDSFKENNELSE